MEHRIILIQMFTVLLITLSIPLVQGTMPHSRFVEITYGGQGVDAFTGVAQLNDDLILVGTTSSFGHGMEDILVMRLDRYGNIKWSIALGGRLNDIGVGVAVTPSHEIVVVGTTWSFGNGQSNIFVSKLSADGRVMWQKVYGLQGNDNAYGVDVLPNGDIVVVGSTDNAGSGHWDGLVLLLSLEGTIIWSKTIGGSLDEGFTAVKAFGNNIYTVGYATSIGKEYDNILIVSLNFSGKINWVNVYSYNKYLDPTSIAIEGNYIAVVGTVASPSSTSDGFLLILDSNGKPLKEYLFGGNEGDKPTAVLWMTPEILYIIGGTWSYGAGRWDGWISKVTFSSSSIISYVCGGNLSDGFNDGITIGDTLYAVGFSSSYGYQGDAWVVSLRNINECDQCTKFSLTINSLPLDMLPGSSLC